MPAPQRRYRPRRAKRPRRDTLASGETFRDAVGEWIAAEGLRILKRAHLDARAQDRAAGRPTVGIRPALDDPQRADRIRDVLAARLAAFAWREFRADVTPPNELRSTRAKDRLPAEHLDDQIARAAWVLRTFNPDRVDRWAAGGEAPSPRAIPDQLVADYARSGLSPARTAEMLGFGRSTVYRALARMRAAGVDLEQRAPTLREAASAETGRQVEALLDPTVPTPDRASTAHPEWKLPMVEEESAAEEATE